MVECGANAGWLTHDRSVVSGSQRSIAGTGTRISRNVVSNPIWVVAAFWLLVGQAAGAAATRNVLVLYSNNRLVPGNIEVDHGLRSMFAGPAAQPVQIFSEFLDRPDFGGAAYEGTETTYLREKYTPRPPDAIVAVSDDA